MENDLYKTLGVSKNASDAEIKRAYRSLSLKYHPDRNPSPEAHEKIRIINDAYDVLSDTSKRKRYDMEQQLGPQFFDFPGNGGAPPPMSDLFEMLFQMHPPSPHDMPEIHIFQAGDLPQNLFSKSMNHPLFKQFQDTTLFNTPKAVQKTLTISYLQAYQGCNLPIEIERELYVGDTNICEEETLYVSIPPGIDENEIITLKEKGNVNKRNKKGDVKVNIKLEPHPQFQRKGLDLIYKKQVSLKEALCGFTFEIEHLNGKLLSLNNKKNRAIIAPQFRKSVPNLGFERENSKGALIIEFDVLFPTSLKEEQIQILEKVL
jgi:DnaJ family protein B protein 4